MKGWDIEMNDEHYEQAQKLIAEWWKSQKLNYTPFADPPTKRKKRRYRVYQEVYFGWGKWILGIEIQKRVGAIDFIIHPVPFVEVWIVVEFA